MGVKIGVSLRAERCIAGGVAEGTVNVEVTEEDAEGSFADELILKLIGKARARTILVMASTNIGATGAGGSSQVFEEETDIISHDILLESFRGRTALDNHDIPFSVMLPSGLPASMKEHGVDGGACGVVYAFEARLQRPGVENFSAKGKAKLEVVARPEELIAAPVTVGPFTSKFNRCCVSHGSMSVGFEADRSVVGRGDSRLGVTVVALNDSSYKIKEVCIKLTEETSWYPQGYKDSRKSTVASVVVPGSQLGEASRVAGKGDPRGSHAADADPADAQRQLRELLRAGGGVKQELTIPDSCHSSMQLGFLYVEHVLSVKLKASGFANGPEAWMPLGVVQSAAGAGPGRYTLEANAGGVDKPVLVPESAVTVEYSTGMPQLADSGKLCS